MRKLKKRKLRSILYMGCYRMDIHRNFMTVLGLKKNNVNVLEYNVQSHKILENIIFFIKDFSNKLKYQNYDIILFHSEAHIQFYLAKLLSFIKGVPLVHDIFISKLQTIYFDRQQFKKRKIPKFLLYLILYFIDIIECKFADYLTLDAYSHIKYFHETFNIPIKKFRKVLVGSNDNLFYPMEKIKHENEKFIVGFTGTYIPLQGIEFIIKAAKILESDEEIVFHLIGEGQMYNQIKELVKQLNVKNTVLMGKKPINEIPKLISNFDINLGIFGNTKKATQVIATKIFDGIAMKKPTITAETPAIRELFTNNKNIILCERANPESLANAILNLKHNETLRNKIADNGYELFKKHCNIYTVGKSWKITLTNILNKKK